MDLSTYVDQKCTIETVDGDNFEGLVQAASALGVLVKPKGTSTPRLIETANLQTIELVAAEPSVLRQKRLDPTTDKKVRRHLLDSHGWLLSVVNTMDDNEALKAHDELDHSDLGHNHNGRAKSDQSNETEDDE